MYQLNKTESLFFTFIQVGFIENVNHDLDFLYSVFERNLFELNIRIKSISNLPDACFVFAII